jgi:hypothetical protein
MLTTQRHDRRARRRAQILLESLDERLVLSAGAGGAAAEAVVHYPVANRAHLHHARARDVLGHGSPASLPANVSPALRLLYREYEDRSDGSRFTPVLPGRSPLLISDSRVAVLIRAAYPPALDAYLPKFRADGEQVMRTVPAHGLVEGMLPIANLPAVAQIAASVTPARPAIVR